MTHDEVCALLDARDPLAAAAPIAPPGDITWRRGPSDQLAEVVQYGLGTTHAQIASRLIELAAQPQLTAVVLLPGGATPDRPGSWGVEDLLVTAVARRVLPPGVAIRNDWQGLGGPACQVAASFGATEWCIPEGDDTDPVHLAQAIGARAVAR